MYRVVMISTKDATNVSPSYMTALATEKKNMYYTRMLLARCNNALMSGIIDSFFYVKGGILILRRQPRGEGGQKNAYFTK